MDNNDETLSDLFKVLKIEYPELASSRIYPVLSARANRVFYFELAGGTKYMISLPLPGSHTRSQEIATRSEAALLHWLWDLNDPGSRDWPMEKPGFPGESVAHPLPITGASCLKLVMHDCQASMSLSPFLPRLICNNTYSAGDSISFNFNITQPTEGETVASLAVPLTRYERNEVELQIGQLMRRISTNISPTRRFGPANLVLAIDPGSSIGSACWSDAFRSMLETCLSNAPSHSVRSRAKRIWHHFDRFEDVLNRVTIPCLVVVNALEDNNILVSRVRTSKATGQWRSLSSESTSEDDAVLEMSPGSASENSEIAEPRPSIGTEESSSTDIKVRGLRDWADADYCDPAIATAHCELSPYTLHGLHSILPENRGTADPPASLFQDPDGFDVRRLLYITWYLVRRLGREFTVRGACDASIDKFVGIINSLDAVLEALDALDDEGFPLCDDSSDSLTPEELAAKKMAKDIAAINLEAAREFAAGAAVNEDLIMLSSNPILAAARDNTTQFTVDEKAQVEIDEEDLVALSALAIGAATGGNATQFAVDEKAQVIGAAAGANAMQFAVDEKAPVVDNDPMEVAASRALLRPVTENDFVYFADDEAPAEAEINGEAELAATDDDEMDAATDDDEMKVTADHPAEAVDGVEPGVYLYSTEPTAGDEMQFTMDVKPNFDADLEMVEVEELLS